MKFPTRQYSATTRLVGLLYSPSHHLKKKQLQRTRFLDQILAMAWNNGDLLRLDLSDEVSHVIGSSAQKNNWKQYWMKNTGRQFPQVCQIYNCGKSAKVGAHIFVKHKRQNFILPTCQSCNMDPSQAYGNGWVSVKANAVVVRVGPHANTYE